MRVATYLIAGIVLAGSGATTSGCASPVQPSDFTLTSLAETNDTESDLTAQATFVIRDADTLRRVWTQLFRGRREVPEVDFTQHMLVVATMGPQPTTGYHIRITGVSRRDRGLLIHVTASSPGPTCVVAQTRTFPIAVARLRRFEGRVAFDFTRITRDCDAR